jgi:protein phosphatase 1 regulatory subunit 7
VYLEANPLAQDAAYRRKLKLIVPTLTQIDATLCR